MAVAIVAMPNWLYRTLVVSRDFGLKGVDDANLYVLWC